MRSHLCPFIFLIAAALLLVGCAPKQPAPTPTPSQTQAPSPSPAASLGTVNVGRYAAAKENLLIYASNNALWRYQDGAVHKLCDVAQGQIPEDLYICDEGKLYFSAILPAADDQGYNRVIYRLALDEPNAAPAEYTRGFGPMAVTGGIIHVMQNGEIICIDPQDGAQLSCAKPGALAQLLQTSFGGKHLYYLLYRNKDADGIPYGQASLRRVDLESLATDTIGDVDKPNADIFTIADHILYRRAKGADSASYQLNIIDTADGMMETPFAVPRAVLDTQLGGETLFRQDSALHLLTFADANDGVTLTNRRLSDATPTELWSTAFNTPVTAMRYDAPSGGLVVLGEGENTSTFNIFSLDPLTGTPSASYTGALPAADAPLRLVTLGGTVLLFTTAGEDAPNPTLVYAAALDNLSAPLVGANPLP